MGTAFPSASMQTSVIIGVLLLVASAQAQQMCLSTYKNPGPDAVVKFEEISTVGTGSIEESLVDVSLANSTGEIKIKAHRNSYFYLLVTASQKALMGREGRKARLFLMVNGKVPLKGVVYFDHYVYGRLETKETLRVVGMDNEPSMPLGVLEFSEEEATFGDMEFIHNGDSLRVMADSFAADTIGRVSVCIFFDEKSFN